jgi:hypothetical protein
VGDGVLAGWWLLFALWVIAVAGFVAALAVSRVLTGPLSCELNSATSVYGQARWSWGELGTVCRWDLGTAGPFERGPGLSRWAFALALAGMGAALLLAGGSIRRARGRSIAS